MQTSKKKTSNTNHSPENIVKVAEIISLIEDSKKIDA